jgi:integrase
MSFRGIQGVDLWSLSARVIRVTPRGAKLIVIPKVFQVRKILFERSVLTIPLDKSGQTSHVPLNAPALEALRGLYQQHGKSAFVCGGRCRSRSRFEALINPTKIQGFTWHCLRHTFAIRLVMSGADLRTVAELLRDKTLAMVMRYAHVAPDYTLAAVECMRSSFAISISIKLIPAVEAQKSASPMVQ